MALSVLKDKVVAAFASVVERVERRMYRDVALPPGFVLPPNEKAGHGLSPRSADSASTRSASISSGSSASRGRSVRFLVPANQAGGKAQATNLVVVTPLDAPKFAKKRGKLKRRKKSNKVTPVGGAGAGAGAGAGGGIGSRGRGAQSPFDSLSSPSAASVAQRRLHSRGRSPVRKRGGRYRAGSLSAGETSDSDSDGSVGRARRRKKRSSSRSTSPSASVSPVRRGRAPPLRTSSSPVIRTSSRNSSSSPSAQRRRRKRVSRTRSVNSITRGSDSDEASSAMSAFSLKHSAAVRRSRQANDRSTRSQLYVPHQF